jgi:hypothetical protein
MVRLHITGKCSNAVFIEKQDKAIVIVGAMVFIIGLFGLPPIADLLPFPLATGLLLRGAGLALHRKEAR